MLDLIRNSRKPILGAISAAVSWVILKVGLDLDPDLAAAISTFIFGAIVRLAAPVFGYPEVTTPQIKDGRRVDR